MELIDAAADAAGADDDRKRGTLADEPPVEPSKIPASNQPPAPSLASAAQRIPESTHALLDELFKAKITAVKRIPRDQLR